MAKGVVINLNSGSDYTDCAIFTGVTEATATGTTEYSSVTGGTVNLTGLDDSLEEIYVKITCVGCCEQVFYVCLTTVAPTATPNPTVTPDPTSTSGPTSTPVPTPTDTPVPTSTSAPTSTPSPTTTVAPTPTPTPGLTLQVVDSYKLLTGGTTYYVSSTAPTSTNAQTVYCDISNREEQAPIYGVTYRYFSNPVGIGTQLFLFNGTSTANNVVGYYNALGTGAVGMPSGTTYYIKTDSSGYITDFVPMTYCWVQHNVVWSFNYDCTSACDLVGSTGLVLYTDGNTTSWGNGLEVYSDPQRTTYFPSGRYIKYQGYIWENDGANGLSEVCIVGNPC